MVAGHAVEVADSFSPSELARLLHSLAMLSFYHKGLFERAEGLVREQLDDFSAEDLALTATAFVSPLPPALPVFCNYPLQDL